MESAINTKYNNKIAMGIYHLDTRWCSHKDFDYITRELGIVNAVRIANDGVASVKYACDWAKECGGQVWLSVPVFISKKETIEEYIETLVKYVDKLKKADAWDYVVGFQWDEPLLKKGHTNEDFYAMTKAVSETFGKRIFPVFSFYEIVGKRGNEGDPDFQWLLKKECSEYITDVAFDVYGYDFSNPNDEDTIKEYKRLEKSYGVPFNSAEDIIEYHTKAMLDLMMYPDKVRVWYFPDGYICNRRTGPAGKVNEQNCIDSLKGFKNLLLKQKNPGGLFIYTYKSWDDHDGLDWQLDKDNPNQWKKYIEASKEVFDEIAEIDLK